MSVSLGPNVPRRGNAFSRWLGRMVLRAMGWRLLGTVPDLPKMIMIGAPHTSNMDGVVSFAAMTALGLRAGTMVKDSAFRGATGVLLRWLGAQPIDRRSAKGVVEQTIDAFNRLPAFVLLLAPEGTRSAAPEWKRGFYHVARGARVPVLPAAIDYDHKRITFGPPLAAKRRLRGGPAPSAAAGVFTPGTPRRAMRSGAVPASVRGAGAGVASFGRAGRLSRSLGFPRNRCPPGGGQPFPRRTDSPVGSSPGAPLRCAYSRSTGWRGNRACPALGME